MKFNIKLNRACKYICITLFSLKTVRPHVQGVKTAVGSKIRLDFVIRWANAYFKQGSRYDLCLTPSPNSSTISPSPPPYHQIHLDMPYDANIV